MECTWGEELRPAARVAPVHRAIPPLVAGACVAVGVLLAVAGDTAGDGAQAKSAATARPAAVTAYVPDRAAVHRKHVFDERRARFDAAHRGATGDVAVGR